jgi:hypothetical protein
MCILQVRNGSVVNGKLVSFWLVVSARIVSRSNSTETLTVEIGRLKMDRGKIENQFHLHVVMAVHIYCCEVYSC